MCSQIPTIPEKSRPLRSVIATNRQTQIPSQPYSVNTKVDPSIEEEVEGLFRPSQESGDYQDTQATESEYQNCAGNDARKDNHVRIENNANNTFQTNNVTTMTRMKPVRSINQNSNPSSHKPYTDLVCVHDVLDSMYWRIIPYDYFNRIQSAVCDAILHSSENIVVSAPTVSIFSLPSLQGCGKTVLLELAVLKLHHEWVTDPSTSPAASFPYSIVYVCPTKALCNEIFTKWSSTFASLGLKCVVRNDQLLRCRKSRGTQTPSLLVCFILSTRFLVELHKQLASFHIIFTTPEKLEILSRRWSAPFGDDSFVERLRLLMIDEIHLLNEPRGANIETIISRLRSNHRHAIQSTSEECAAKRSFSHPTCHALCDLSEQRGCGAVAPRQAFLVRFELSSRSDRANRDRIREPQSAKPIPVRGWPFLLDSV